MKQIQGSSKETSPIEIQKYLGGVDHPASKENLVSAAQGHDAPDDVIRVLRGLS